jgi:aldehyde dehydrogenase (NAD+)
MEIQNIVENQKAYFNSNRTKDFRFRIEQLKKLKTILRENEKLFYEAIYQDFGKSKFETYATEFSLIYHEINLALSNIRKWGRSKRVSTGLVNFPATSYIMPEPLGTTLIIGAWNYPYQLTLLPAISSMAAGNTVILKPSELPSRTSNALASLLNNHFESTYFHVIEGGPIETTQLLENHFDKIFFTGSIPIGKIIYQAAAKHLTPVTLELGGKSPAFVISGCDIKMTAKRLAWAKFLNAGQTCVAPDYILVEKSIEDDFLKALYKELDTYPKSYQEFSEHYTQIINLKNFDRLYGLIDQSKICYGGKVDREARFISPTVLRNVYFEDKIMEDEIFGPVLPVVSFTDINVAINEVKRRPKPLACYVFSTNRKTIKKILNELSFGGGAINDSVMQLTNSNLPFGGVGFSGMGSYHGKAGFAVFSHFKSVLHKPFWFEACLKYPPYSKLKLTLIKWLIE